MTNRSSFAEARFSLEGLTEAESDYAAEYRSNVQNVPGKLKGVARIGVDSLGGWCPCRTTMPPIYRADDCSHKFSRIGHHRFPCAKL